ncbi:hypothetical protein DY000_02009434 [Brassica cretica]|uniref:Secreted protein n=1 Tax=Brassica cretica TaxID=69181 RepID=A0ABQ7CKA7_BRACR|nr:hypothetical protein DY000_02009434 [Brassica cretica]
MGKLSCSYFLVFTIIFSVGFCSDKKSRTRPLRPGVISATGGITVRFWSVSWDSPASVCLSPIVSSPCELRCSFRSETGPEQTYAGGVGALFNPARVNDCVVCSKSSSMASCGQLVRPLHLSFIVVFSPMASERTFHIRVFALGSQGCFRRQWRALAQFGMRFKASCGVTYKPCLVAITRLCYSGGVKRISGIQGNEENLTFSRVTLMVENGDRY